MRNDRAAVEFKAIIKSISSKIDIVGDKIAKMTLEFTASDNTLNAVTLLQQPGTTVLVSMVLNETGKV